MAGLLLAVGLAAQPDVQSALREGGALERAGDFDGALESYSYALDKSPPQSPERAEALLGLATIETGLGRYPKAKGHAEEAIAAFSALRDSLGLAKALNRAGLVALYQADYPQAETRLVSALAASASIGDTEGTVEESVNLANVYYFVGRYADAARLYDEALAETNRASSAPWAARRRRIVLANQATLYQRLGRDQEALSIYRDLGAGQTLAPREQAQVLTNLGVLYRRLGDPIKALASYDAARATYARERDVDGELGVLKNRGIVLAIDLARLGEAERTFTEAVTVAAGTGNRRELLHGLLYRGETRVRAGDDGGARTDFTQALGLARELRTPEEEWKALYGLGRTAAAAERVPYLSAAVETVEHLRENIRVPSLRADFFNDKRDVYDALIAARLAGGASPAEMFGLLERSHSREWRERLGLAGTVDLRAVQAALAPGDLMLDYWHSASGSAVVAVTRSRVAVVPLTVDSGRIGALIGALSSGPAASWRSLADPVASVLPDAAWFESIDRLIVVPDGAIALVPFDVLAVGGRLLVERVALSYTPTAATLLRPPLPGRRLRVPWAMQLRGFGDPAFTSSRLEDANAIRGRLGASGDEIRGVAAQLSGRAVLHVGSDDRKAYLMAPDERAPILHLATHALADETAMEQSRILFAPSRAGDRTADYLFLREAYELPLAGVELAVLSACDTARGAVMRAEGVQSFSRAFLASGARSTVTTLWRVADRPTESFMTVFYHHLQQGVPRDEALRRAKVRMLTSGTTSADPHYWAAFVLTGDASLPIPRAIPWTMALAVATAAGLLIAGAVRLARRSAAS